MDDIDKIPEGFKRGFIAELEKNNAVLIKDVRDYSGRKRINITNSDGLIKDDQVVVLRKADYEILINEYERLLAVEKNLNDTEVTADSVSEKFIQPVKDSYTDIINGLKADIRDKDKEINRLKAIYHDYDKQVYNLGLLDILRHENQKISDDFNSKVWITMDDAEVTTAEVKKISKVNKS